MKTLPALVFFLLITNAVFSAEKPLTKVHLFGIGTGKTCGQFVRDTVDNSWQDILTRGGKDYYSIPNVYVEWVGGYLTGYGVGKMRTISKNDVNIYDVMLWIKNYCEKNPFEYFINAIKMAIKEIE